jgi:hypothetical protein
LEALAYSAVRLSLSMVCVRRLAASKYCLVEKPSASVMRVALPLASYCWKEVTPRASMVAVTWPRPS